MVATTAQYGCKKLKTDTKQAFLNGEIGDERYIFALQTGDQGQFFKDMPCC